MEAIKKNVGIIFLCILAVVASLVWHTVFYLEAHRNLLVTFFDVGQGDAIFIEVPNGNQILIDGGPNERILTKLGRVLPFWDRSIDMLILTHPHADHLDGLVEVLKRYDVGMVVESGAEHSIPEYQEWRKLLKESGADVVMARAGQRINVGRGIVLDVLSPFDDFDVKTAKDPHDAMVVTRLRHGENSILLMGDAEKSIEYRLLFESGLKFYSLKSKILKVGHHGSKTSTSEEFLRAVSPEVALIQVGKKNRYGHPRQEVLDRLATAGIRLLRNDIDGDIRLESDGLSYIIRR